MAAQPQLWRQLDRAIQFDAFRLDSASGEMAAGDFRVFGRHPDMAPAARVFLAGLVLRRCDRHSAMPDIEVERRVDLGIIEFHQHVIAGDAELRRAERDKAGDIEAADAD